MFGSGEQCQGNTYPMYNSIHHPNNKPTTCPSAVPTMPDGSLAHMERFDMTTQSDPRWHFTVERSSPEWEWKLVGAKLLARGAA